MNFLLSLAIALLLLGIALQCYRETLQGCYDEDES